MTANKSPPFCEGAGNLVTADKVLTLGVFSTTVGLDLTAGQRPNGDVFENTVTSTRGSTKSGFSRPAASDRAHPKSFCLRPLGL